jgi:hypothetical protein
MLLRRLTDRVPVSSTKLRREVDRTGGCEYIIISVGDAVFLVDECECLFLIRLSRCASKVEPASGKGEIDGREGGGNSASAFSSMGEVRPSTGVELLRIPRVARRGGF